MKRLRIIFVVISILLLIGSIGFSVYFFFSNLQNVRLLQAARANFAEGSESALDLAEAQLLQLVNSDGDNEEAYILLGMIAEKRKIYPERVYYCGKAYRLNPLNKENCRRYVRSLLFVRDFERLENFIAFETSVAEEFKDYLFYAAGHNGTLNKYTAATGHTADTSLAELTHLLFCRKELSAAEKLELLEKFSCGDDIFLQQELLAAMAELTLQTGDIDEAEKYLQAAYSLNEFIFAPVLGRFNASFRSLGEALLIYENYLGTYHDQLIAMEAAEIYCLLGDTGKLAELRKDYQDDSGQLGMLCCYYLDILIAFADSDFAAIRELSPMIKGRVATPLADYIFFCTALEQNNIVEVAEYYNKLAAHRPYLDLQLRADAAVADFLKISTPANPSDTERLLALAQKLYSRVPDAFTARYLLLASANINSINASLLRDALSRFPDDPDIIKIAIEYYLDRSVSIASQYIDTYKNAFPQKTEDIVRFEIILALKEKDMERASELFRNNFHLDIHLEYWSFAAGSCRAEDLLVLSGDKLYAPFCRALLLLLDGRNAEACDILETADAENNLTLLFFAAKTLGENDRLQSALDKYALFPSDSSYQLAVLLNTAEIYAESGNIEEALIFARKAYDSAPQLPETQLCYADKLYKSGNFAIIPDIVKLSNSAYRTELERLWIVGMQAKISSCDINKEPEKIRTLCQSLLRISPGNATAVDILEQLEKMPQ